MTKQYNTISTSALKAIVFKFEIILIYSDPSAMCLQKASGIFIYGGSWYKSEHHHSLSLNRKMPLSLQNTVLHL
jgi:hypothetical protein